MAPDKAHYTPEQKAIGLEYGKHLLTQDDIAEAEKLLGQQGYELRSHQTSTEPTNSVDGLASQVIILLNEAASNDLVKNVALGLATNALWDGIKLTIGYLWRQASGKIYRSFNIQEVTERKVSSSVRVFLSKESRFEFKLDNVSEATLNQSLDKLVGLLGSQQATQFSTPFCGVHYAEYDPETDRWVPLEVTPSLLKERAGRIIQKISLDEYRKLLEEEAKRKGSETARRLRS